MTDKSNNFYNFMNTKRSVRYLSSRSFPRKIIENIIHTAGTAPSGAIKQPWTYVVINDSGFKRHIRKAPEEKKKNFLLGRKSNLIV